VSLTMKADQPPKLRYGTNIIPSKDSVEPDSSSGNLLLFERFVELTIVQIFAQMA
jgi:hypothetical protein